MSPQPSPRMLVPSTIDEYITLRKSLDKVTEPAKKQYQQISKYVHSSLTIGRHLNRAIVLTLGVSGHGKSKTINTLVGKEILLVAKGSEGSTTEVVQRTSVDSVDPVSGISITLSFDDSPGLDDRTSKKRARMETLVGEYDRKYYPDMSPTDLARVSTSAHFRGKTYPNAILLVTSWDSVRRDAESSSIGTTMQYLAGSGLIDHQHPNVVVVVTKALTFWSDYDDFDEDQKGKQWQRDAHEKSTIINDLRSNTFSSSTTWPVIFVENGGGKKILRRHRTLPNGELSHQNLFEAIARIVTQAKDLVGIQALRFVTGADSVVSQLQPTPREVLCQCGDGGVPSGKERAVMVASKRAGPATTIDPTPHNIAVAKTHLGFAYNPVFRRFGRTPIVAFRDSDIRINRCSSHQREFMVYTNDANQRNTNHAAQLRTEFTVRSVAGASANHSSTDSSGSSSSSASHEFESAIITAIATLGTETLTPSNQIRAEIDALPPWDESSQEVKAQYRMFFGKHGTHFNVQAALGGVLRVMSRDNFNKEQESVLRMISANVDSPITALIGVNAGGSASHNGTEERRSASARGSISIIREGGKVVASDLTSKLEDLFDHFREFTPGSPWLQSWLDIRARWVAALETDPAFCADDPGTCYHWLHELDGITLIQKMDLRLASDWYLRGPVEDNQPSSTADPSGSSSGIPLPRIQNLKQVDKTLWDILGDLLRSLWNWIRSWR